MGLPPKSPRVPIRGVAHNPDLDKLEGGPAHSNNGKFKTTESLTGPPSSSDHNSCRLGGREVGGSSSKSEVVEVKKSPSELNGGSDSIIDPKRRKRILANRLSAQRSRFKKMQYITALERSVSALEAEIGLLSPQVAYYDNQRRLLNAEKSVIMQRITALMHEQASKNAQFEALRIDEERLNNLLSRLQDHEQQQQYMISLQFDDTKKMNTELMDPLDFIYC